MNKKNCLRVSLLLLFIAAIVALAPGARAQTAFTYQGHLRQFGTNVNGIAFLNFRLYDAVASGTQIGPMISFTNVPMTAGIFNVTLDFGAGSFNGSDRWLEISANFVPLTPRQLVGLVPQSSYAVQAGLVSGGVVTNSTLTGGQIRNPAFFGTTTTNPLVLSVNGTTVWQMIPTSEAPNLLAGFTNNAVSNQWLFITNTGSYFKPVVGAVVAGGGAPLDVFGSSAPNSVADNYGTVSGGAGNRAGNTNGSQYATASGGLRNTAGAFAATVGGGYSNTVTADYGTIGGGSSNSVTAIGGVISGGVSNSVTSLVGAVGGGFGNSARGESATVAGGYQNVASGDGSFIGAGSGNRATNSGGAVVAGDQNFAAGDGAFVGAGSANAAFAQGGVVAGGYSNTNRGQSAAVVAGSFNLMIGDQSFIGAGNNNTVTNVESAVAAGNDNRVTGVGSFIGAGESNVVTSDFCVVAGGLANSAGAYNAFVGAGGQNAANGNNSCVVSGGGNTAAADYSMILGGYSNYTGGTFACAMGYGARAMHSGAFVWSDTAGGFSSTSANEFSVRAGGGVRLIVGPFGALAINNGGAALTGSLTTTAGATFAATVSAPGFNVTSDRNAKQDFAPVDSREVLAKVAALPIQTWTYKQDETTRHIGPMAQDFSAAFGVGPDDRHISTVDADGVALAAIQGLNAVVKEKNVELDALKRRVTELEKMVRSLAARKGSAQ